MILPQTPSLERLRGLRVATLEKHLGGKGASFHAVLRTPLNAAALFDAYLPAHRRDVIGSPAQDPSEWSQWMK